MRLLLVVAIALLSATSLRAQIEWLTWEEAQDRQALAPRKLLVDVYTEWCGWCDRMDEQTFTDPDIVAEVRANFYAVKLDAEHVGELQYDGNTYELEPGGRRATHALARELLGGRLGYPTVVFLDEANRVIQAVPGYHDAEAFLEIARYFGRDHYREVSWEEFGDR